jgi:hypothetical protein
MMNEIVGIYKYVVDGEYAERLHDVFKHSYFIENECVPLPYQNCKMQVKFSFEDGVFRVEETTTAPLSYIAEIICFFADKDNIFCLSEHIVNGVTESYDIDDSEGKYFVRPPKTEWELQQEEKQNRRMTLGIDDDLPF